MTARRVVTLLCDKPGCRQSYIGSASDFDIVREVARSVSGWSTVRVPEHHAGVVIAHDVLDFCRFHA